MSKVKANLKWVNGVIQENVGSVIGNEKMEIEGATKRAQGEAEYQKAQSENNPNNENVGKLQANIKWANGAVKENVGNLIGDKELETAGAIERSEGNQEYQRLAQQSDKPIKASDKFNANLKWADGVAKENIGSVTGNTRMQVEGIAKRSQADFEIRKAQTEDDLTKENPSGKRKIDSKL